MNEILREVWKEYWRAQEKHPVSAYNGFAVIKQAGDVAKAILHTVDKDAPEPVKRYDVHTQAIQCMAACLRLIREGDKSLGIPPYSTRDGESGESGRQGQEHPGGGREAAVLLPFEGVPSQFY